MLIERINSSGACARLPRQELILLNCIPTFQHRQIWQIRFLLNNKINQLNISGACARLPWQELSALAQSRGLEIQEPPPVLLVSIIYYYIYNINYDYDIYDLLIDPGAPGSLHIRYLNLFVSRTIQLFVWAVLSQPGLSQPSNFLEVHEPLLMNINIEYNIYINITK